MFWNSVLSLFGLGKTYIEGKQKLKLNEQEAITKTKIFRMENKAEWEKHVAGVSSRFLRWTLAIHLLAGLDFTIYLSVSGADNPAVIFQAMEYLPEWYAGLLMTIFGWAFASEPVKNAGGKLAAMWRAKAIKKEVKND